jgi:hypothetical protein
VSADGPGIEQLEDAALRLELQFPGLHVRFASVMGRRLSHIAGTASDIPGEQRTLEVSSGLVAVVSGRIPPDIEELMEDLFDSDPAAQA